MTSETRFLQIFWHKILSLLFIRILMPYNKEKDHG